jgi:hypothetical protein
MQFRANLCKSMRTVRHHTRHLGTTDGTVFRAFSGIPPVGKTGALPGLSTHPSGGFRVVDVARAVPPGIYPLSTKHARSKVWTVIG